MNDKWSQQLTIDCTGHPQIMPGKNMGKIKEQDVFIVKDFVMPLQQVAAIQAMWTKNKNNVPHIILKFREAARCL